MWKKSAGSDWKEPPRRDAFEITLFGPGFGECAVIHVGGGRWIIIDSCIDQSTSEPASLSYLFSLGYAPRDCVDLVIATHWHDDHIRGIARVLEKCERAEFCCSGAFRKQEFASFLEAINERPLTSAGSGVREIHEVMRLLSQRATTARLATTNRCVLRKTGSETGHGLEVAVTTVSPSDKQIELFHQELWPLISGEEGVRVVSQGPNHLTVVTVIEIGPMAALFGGDLEETSHPGTGWTAIVASRERPQRRAAFFKVPHHGSKNAHSDAVWSAMLLDNPIAALTPWQLGSGSLPTKDDESRIAAKTSRAFVTATPVQSRSKSPRAPAVEKQLREMNVQIRRAEARTGAIRVRGFANTPSESWTIELRDDARALN